MCEYIFSWSQSWSQADNCLYDMFNTLIGNGKWHRSGMTWACGYGARCRATLWVVGQQAAVWPMSVGSREKLCQWFESSSCGRHHCRSCVTRGGGQVRSTVTQGSALMQGWGQSNWWSTSLQTTAGWSCRTHCMGELWPGSSRSRQAVAALDMSFPTSSPVPIRESWTFESTLEHRSTAMDNVRDFLGVFLMVRDLCFGCWSEETPVCE